MPTEDEDLLEEARELFDLAAEAEEDNRRDALEDMKFVKLREQWPEKIKQQRDLDRRPCLTFDLLDPFCRQVINDARQNKPGIKVHPADSAADPDTARVISDLIRNIEYVSSASIAYDTGIECAIRGGMGYWRVDVDYAHDDTFDMDLLIRRITNPFSAYGDPNSSAADSSDWDNAFVVDRLSKKKFEAKYGEDKAVDWEGEGYTKLDKLWFDDDTVMIAEWWHREEVDRPICLLDDGSVIDKARLEETEETGDGGQVTYYDILQALGRQIVEERTAKSHKVTQRLMSGAEILETVEWRGRYIPIVPVYGDEFDIEGKRYFSSLVRSAKEAQQSFNIWNTAAAELVALAPKAKWIGTAAQFADDPNWADANNNNVPYLTYTPDAEAPQPPTRTSGVDPAIAQNLQQAALAGQLVQRILGIFDASLGAPSNEKSGRAILARQREGDVSTFHFSDNQSRAIAHTGRILIDLIPSVYSRRRMLRVIGEDGNEQQIPLGQPTPIMGPGGQPRMQPNPQNPAEEIPLMKIHDLSAGKYDLTVTTGPSFTTRREESAQQMIEMVRAMPDIAPIIMDLVAKNLDWPGAEEIAERFKAMVPDKAKGGLPPQIQKQMQEAQQAFKKMTAEMETMRQENAKLKLQAEDRRMQNMVKAAEAETERIKVMADARISDVDLKLKLMEMFRQEPQQPQVMAA